MKRDLITKFKIIYLSKTSRIFVGLVIDANGIHKEYHSKSWFLSFFGFKINRNWILRSKKQIFNLKFNIVLKRYFYCICNLIITDYKINWNDKYFKSLKAYESSKLLILKLKIYAKLFEHNFLINRLNIFDDFSKPN
jgi:hypothetical protein